MFKTCFLHIGMEKTGTTSIQKMMANNRKRLAKAGYCYSWAMGRDNHVNLVVYARDDDTTDNQRKRALATTGLSLDKFRELITADLAKEADKHNGKHLILSNEHLQSRLTNVGEKKRLQSLLEPFCENIQIYLYIRRQDKAATSVFGTRLLSGGLTTLANIMPEVPENGPKPYFYDYLTLWREFCEVFGAENVHVRVFEPDQIAEGDICKDFPQWLGIDQEVDLKIPPRENESISEAAQFLMTRMNSLNPMFLDNVPNPLRGQLGTRLPRVAKGKGRQPSGEEASAFYDHFREDNAILFKEAGLPGENFREGFEDKNLKTFNFGGGAVAVADVCVDLFKDVVGDLNTAKQTIRELENRIKELESD